MDRPWLRLKSTAFQVGGLEHLSTLRVCFPTSLVRLNGTNAGYMWGAGGTLKGSVYTKDSEQPDMDAIKRTWVIAATMSLGLFPSALVFPSVGWGYTGAVSGC